MSTGIEWTGKTWNPTTGCSKLGIECKFCYAEGNADRMRYHPNDKIADAYRNGFRPTYQPQRLGQPYKWKKPTNIFVNSMSDLFHEKFDLAYIQAVFDVMNRTPRHTYQVLTKRADILAKVADKLTWSDNIWIGTSVGVEASLHRVDSLRKVPTNNRFLSIEPLLEALPSLTLDGVGWVIVGGESGKGHRPVQESWITPIRDACLIEDIPFFFKQWGGAKPKSGGKELQGQTWCQMPA